MARLPSHHGANLRGLSIVPDSSFHQGRFGRMFRNLPRFEPSDDAIQRLAKRMSEPKGAEEDEALNNPDIPAGFTYFGQFLDHDITFDPVSSLTRQNDPDALRDFRTPRLDLDSVYGAGPSDQPYLYESDNEHFIIGSNGKDQDLQRNARGRAIIGDPRNDENFIVSQIQHAWLRFHNKVVDDIRGNKLDKALWSKEPGDVFSEAQRIVRWHYQWIVITDFLPRIVGADLLKKLIEPIPGTATGKRFNPIPRYYNPAPLTGAFMPIEFSAAAYRYGHSQIRPEYELNEQIKDKTIFPTAKTPNPTDHLEGFRPLIQGWKIEWGRFFELDRPKDDRQQSRLIDTKLAPPLFRLPQSVDADERALAFLNLTRGKRMDLPSGQAIARLLGEEPLDSSELGLDGDAPLWFYVLAEAEKRAKGRHLGPVGGRIVAEVILGLIDADAMSFLSVEPGWQPFLPSSTPGVFTMASMLRYATPELL